MLKGRVVEEGSGLSQNDSKSVGTKMCTSHSSTKIVIIKAKTQPKAPATERTKPAETLNHFLRLNPRY